MAERFVMTDATGQSDRIGRWAWSEIRGGTEFHLVEFAGGDPECADLLDGEFADLDGVAALNAQARFVLEDMLEHVGERDAVLADRIRAALGPPLGRTELEADLFVALSLARPHLSDEDYSSASGLDAEDLGRMALDALTRSGRHPSLSDAT